MHPPFQLVILFLCSKCECLQGTGRHRSPTLKIYVANVKNILVEVFILTIQVTEKQYACVLMWLAFILDESQSFCKIHRKLKFIFGRVTDWEQEQDEPESISSSF